MLHGFWLHLFDAIKRIPFLEFQQAAPGGERGWGNEWWLGKCWVRT